ncbi:hypothetical protein [Paraferrimonas sedimenticola]|uniref:Uncharacterized protein n=1 Tax=Paraferrimonas sedimenticola TaxID=375674 RepID=A0AA37RW81_9GAMM|nr:hypothetical protein [Paraferrimonas sedimenticola]GLP96134.1 hypothetical protein GCM10007895_14400 [Paraferrimonas sedimenticola]
MTLLPQAVLSRLAILLVGLMCASLSITSVSAQELSISELVKNLNDKRHAYMETFNELVEDKDLAYECRYSYGSTILRRSFCYHAFEWRIRAERKGFSSPTGSAAKFGIGGAASDYEKTKKKYQERFASLEKAFNEMLEDHPSLNTSYNEFIEPQQAYQRGHVAKFGIFSKYYKD